MISMLSNFLNNSIASLSIYDIFIVILFTLVLILCIVSGIIIVSARVKKINLELDKNKNIQEIQSKIITNRLDLILNKLNNNLLSLNNLTNKDIKNALISNSNEDIVTDENIPPKVIIDNNNTSEIPYVSSNTLPDEDINIPINNPVVDSSKQNELSSSEIEQVSINQEKLPQDLRFNKSNKIDITENIEDNPTKTIDISENLNKKSNICIDTTRNYIEDDENNEINSSFEKGECIPLEINSNKEFNNKKIRNNQEEDISFCEDYEEYNPKESYSLPIEDHIVIANKFLNELKAFSNEEKFKITNFISEDGKYIENLTNNELNKLNKKELIKQLFIQTLITKYDYPVENIEVNYDLNLSNNIYKKADIIVFDTNDESYLLVVIDTQNEQISLKSLTKIAKYTITPFVIWTNGNTINYYENLNGNLKKISDIPQYNEDTEYNNSSSVFHPLYKKSLSYNKEDNYNNTTYDSLNKNIPQNTSPYFSKDIFNIFKKEPYSLSDEYKSIISQYKNFSSTYGNKIIPVINQHNNYLPLNSSNITPLPHNINHNFNNFINNNLPPMCNNIHLNKNLPRHSSFNNMAFHHNQPMPKMPPMFQSSLNNANLTQPYSNQFYQNNHNLSFMEPNIHSQINFSNNLPSENRFSSYTRFNNYNMFPTYL